MAELVHASDLGSDDESLEGSSPFSPTITLEILMEIANPADCTLNRYELMGKKSVLKRGLPYYGRLREEFPIHFHTFSRMHKRNHVDFPQSNLGLISFILEIGPVPDDMLRPSIGRKDHSIGYVVGNYAWQEFTENSKEGGLRTGFATRPDSTVTHSKHAELIDRLTKLKEPASLKVLFKELDYCTLKYLRSVVKGLGCLQDTFTVSPLVRN